MIHPEFLRPGDRVALIAPASCVSEKEIDNAVRSIRFLDLEPVVFPGVHEHHGYMAGRDEVRLKELHDAFADDTIKGVFCIRGGFGCGRILDRVDFDLIGKHPKVFLGFSDVVLLHFNINQKCGFTTIHGAMPNIDWTRRDSWTVDSIRRWVFGFPEGPAVIPPEEPLGSLNSGSAEGRITGGNLSLVVSTLSSPWEIDTKDKILYLEDYVETDYSIDRMITALSLAGKFRDAAGVILGPFLDISREEPRLPEFPVEKIFEEVILPWGKPVLTNYRAGHTYPHMAFPMGAKCRIDADKKTIAFFKD